MGRGTEIGAKFGGRAAISFVVCALSLAMACAFANARNPTTVARADGVKAGPIRMGMVTALTGPVARLGKNVRAGVLAAFEEVNRAGGIKGCRLELLCADDGYEPSRTGPLVRELIERDSVIAFIGNVGTPTGVVTMPICKEKRVPFVAPFTGASRLRPNPVEEMVFHFRASYHEEIGAMIDALIDHAGMTTKDIAFFTQRDAYGDAGFAGGLAAMQRRGASEDFKPLHTRYERNTLDVESALADCLSANPRPKAIIMVGAYAPCAQFIRLARASKLEAIYLNVSFVGSEFLAENLTKDHAQGGDGVIVTQVVPTLDKETDLTRQFAAALSALPHDSAVEPGLGALEGYIVGKMACLALRRCEGPVTSQSFAESLAKMGPFDLGLGVPLKLDSTDHQASHTVWPSIIRGGKVVSFDWKDIGTATKADNSTLGHEDARDR